MRVYFPKTTTHYRHDTEQDFRTEIERALRDMGHPTRLVDAPERYAQREADHLRRVITLAFTRAGHAPPVLPPAAPRYSLQDAEALRRILTESFERLP